jgi:hypothetical protein
MGGGGGAGVGPARRALRQRWWGDQVGPTGGRLSCVGCRCTTIFFAMR